MAEPVKIKFEYQNPENVEAEVPGAQKLREAQVESETGEILSNEPSQMEETSKVSNEGLELATNNYSTEPVIVVTKKEATFTKGDLKLQKVTVTEDISLKYQHLFKKQTLPGKTVVTQENPENGEPVSLQEEGNEVTTRLDRRHVLSGKRNGIHGEPVMLDKLEDKKSRTKIPVSRFRQTVEKVKEERRGARGEHESQIPVRRSSIPKPVKENKIPPTTVKKEITITKTVIKNDSAEPVVTETVITKETSEPNATEKRIVTTIVTEIENETIKPEDEFDKIYAEIVNTPTEVVFDDSLLNPKVEDPVKLESKFEEIIHDYDEHKVEPIDVEVIRRSKLPLLKRKSQQEIELSAQAERTSKIIAARDKLRLRHSMNMDDNFEQALDDELNNTQAEKSSNVEENTNTFLTENDAPKFDTKTEKETKHAIITSPNSKTEITRQFTKTVSTSSSNEQENSASSSVVETTTVKNVSTNESNETKQNKQQYITEENIMKGSIKIGIPVFDSYIHDYSETNDTTTTTEVKRVLSYTSNSEDFKSHDLLVTKTTNETTKEKSLSEIMNEITAKLEAADSNSELIPKNKELEVELIKPENIEIVKSVAKDQKETNDILAPAKVTETKINEDVQLRGKVERIISKIDSKEVIEIESHQRESINELRKKKSVLSKIAMFEKKPEEPILTRGPKKETKLPKLITKDWDKVEHVHVHTPLIVDEVFKADISLISEEYKDKTPLKNDDITTIVRAERVIVESPNAVHYAAENKVIIENKTDQEKATEVFPSQTNIETIHKKAIEVISSKANIDSEYTAQKVEIATITNVIPSKESNIDDGPVSPNKYVDRFEFKDVTNKPVSPMKLRISRELSNTNVIASPRANADQFEFRDARNKALSPTRLSMTKELQSPVVIPGFKPVSELLRSFESKRETNRSFSTRSVSKVEHTTITPVKVPEIATIISAENHAITTQISHTGTYNSEIYDDFDTVNDYKSLDDVFTRDTDQIRLKLRQEEDFKRAKSLAELDLGDAVKGKVNNMILRMRSVDKMELDRREAINKKEMPRKRSVSEKIALFEGKLTPSRSESPLPLRIFKADMPTENRTEQKTFRTYATRTEVSKYTRLESQRDKNGTEVAKSVVEGLTNESDEEVIQKNIEELSNAKIKYGKVENMPHIELSNGKLMPVLAVGTALIDPRLTYHVVTAAIDLGYRAIDTAFIYGNEREVGEAIRAKLADGTVKRDELFIISKLWSTYHRTDLVEGACRASLDALGLEYFDLYLIHNPMSFKEGGAAIPKIATVLQYSEHDYMDAWYGMEGLLSKGLVRAIGVSNFNSVQLQKVLDKGRVKPVVNQVECHPYLSQQRLDLFCSERNVTLSCFGVLGSKGTPLELKNGQPAVIDDALVQVMASGLGVSPAQLLISYQLENGHGVVVKASSARHLHDNLLAARVTLTSVQVDALHALNRNKRMFTFKGMGDTHKNYPFNVAF